MRFLRELLAQMGSDLNSLLQGYGPITAYSIATITTVVLTAIGLVSIDLPNTTMWRGIGATGFVLVLFGEVVLAFWLWEAGGKVREKIRKENAELIKSIKSDPETYR